MPKRGQMIKRLENGSKRTIVNTLNSLTDHKGAKEIIQSAPSMIYGETFMAVTRHSTSCSNSIKQTMHLVFTESLYN